MELRTNREVIERLQDLYLKHAMTMGGYPAIVGNARGLVVIAEQEDENGPRLEILDVDEAEQLVFSLEEIFLDYIAESGGEFMSWYTGENLNRAIREFNFRYDSSEPITEDGSGE